MFTINTEHIGDCNQFRGPNRASSKRIGLVPGVRMVCCERHYHGWLNCLSVVVAPGFRLVVQLRDRVENVQGRTTQSIFDFAPVLQDSRRRGVALHNRELNVCASLR